MEQTQSEQGDRRSHEMSVGMTELLKSHGVRRAVRNTFAAMRRWDATQIPLTDDLLHEWLEMTRYEALERLYMNDVLTADEFDQLGELKLRQARRS